jgi:hypothetical protein
LLVPIQGPSHILLIKVQKMSVTKGTLTRVHTERQEDAARINHVYPCLLEEEPGSQVDFPHSQDFMVCFLSPYCKADVHLYEIYFP